MQWARLLYAGLLVVLQTVLLITLTTGLHLHEFLLPDICALYTHTHIHTQSGTRIICMRVWNFPDFTLYKTHSRTFCCFSTLICCRAAKNTSVIESFYPRRYTKHFFFFFFDIIIQFNWGFKEYSSNAVGVCASIFSVCCCFLFILRIVWHHLHYPSPRQHAGYFWHTSERKRQCLNISSLRRCSTYV